MLLRCRWLKYSDEVRGEQRAGDRQDHVPAFISVLISVCSPHLPLITALITFLLASLSHHLLLLSPPCPSSNSPRLPALIIFLLSSSSCSHHLTALITSSSPLCLLSTLSPSCSRHLCSRHVPALAALTRLSCSLPFHFHFALPIHCLSLPIHCCTADSCQFPSLIPLSHSLLSFPYPIIPLPFPSLIPLSHSPLLPFTTRIHCSHLLLSFTALVHCSHPLFSFTACLFTAYHPLFTAVLPIHCQFTTLIPLSFTALIPSLILSFTALIHCSHSLAALVHCSHSLPSLTALTHCSHSLARTHYPRSLLSLTALTHCLTHCSHSLLSLTALADCSR
jgi:hypothetical protein